MQKILQTATQTTMNRTESMRRYLGNTLGDGEHQIHVTTGEPVCVNIEDHGLDAGGNNEYEVVVTHFDDDPDYDIPLEWIVDHVERISGSISDHCLPPMTDEEYSALKSSISQHGVMNPILVDERGNVIEGRQRQRACRELGIKNYPRTVVSKLKLETKRQLAWELNMCRRQVGLSAKREIARTLISRTPWLSDRSISQQAGLDHKTVGSMRGKLQTGGEIPHLPTRTGKDGKRYPSITVHQPKDVQRAALAFQQLGDAAPNKAMDLRCAERMVRQHKMDADRGKAIVVPTPTDAIQIVHSDFRSLKIESGSAGMVMTDPPYLKEFLPIWDDLGAFAARVLRPGGMLVTYTGQIYLDQVLGSLAKHLRYHWQLVLLHDGGQEVHARHVRSCYKPILCFTNGEAPPGESQRWIIDVLKGYGKDKRLHEWQQNVDEAIHLIEHFSNSDDLIVDPFGGSFTTAEAALRAGGGRRFIGCDVDRACVVQGQERIAKVRKEQGV